MFARHGYEVIHNKNGEHEKNAVGSTLTITLFLIIGFGLNVEVKKSIGTDHDYLQNLIKDYDGSDQKYYWQIDYPITMFEVLGSSFNDAIDLEAEDFRRYIHIYASNVHNRFD